MQDDYIQPDSSKNSAAEIYKRHSILIRKVIRCHIKDEYLADDIFQDFFLYLVANPISDCVSVTEAYIYRSIINCINASMRRTMRRNSYADDYASESANTSTEAHDPGRPAVDAENVAKMFKLIRERLPHSKAKAVILHYGDKRDISEIAQIMRINPKSVSQYISTGLKKIHHVVNATEGTIL